MLLGVFLTSPAQCPSFSQLKRSVILDVACVVSGLSLYCTKLTKEFSFL